MGKTRGKTECRMQSTVNDFPFCQHFVLDFIIASKLIAHRAQHNLLTTHTRGEKLKRFWM